MCDVRSSVLSLSSLGRLLLLLGSTSWVGVVHPARSQRGSTAGNLGTGTLAVKYLHTTEGDVLAAGLPVAKERRGLLEVPWFLP